MSKESNYQLVPDKKGMVWDLMLYVPTVIFLIFIGLKFWYQNNQVLAYVLCFLASFFFIAGADRVLKSRLLLLPHAPSRLSLGRKNVTLTLRNGDRVDLVKDVRFFSDYAGRSFGLTGMDLSGKMRKFILHKGQFGAAKDFQHVVQALKKFH